MKIKFWGVRGSFPVSSAEHMRYGGNTACLEVRNGGDPAIVIDAGTGIRALGKDMVAGAAGAAGAEGKRVELLLSHTHWDHIQGLPHFEPLYNADMRIRVHALKRQTKSLRHILADQQRPQFFPVALEDAAAAVEFVEHEDGDTFDIGDTRITCRRLNHPTVTGGFRVESNGHSMAYVCDTDLYGENLFAEELPAAMGEGAEARRRILEGTRDLSHGVDVLVCDTFFLPDEYRGDFGHSTADDALRLAAETDSKCVALFHHRPGREDGTLDTVVERYREQAGRDTEVLGSSEGLELTL